MKTYFVYNTINLFLVQRVRTPTHASTRGRQICGREAGTIAFQQIRQQHLNNKNIPLLSGMKLNIKSTWLKTKNIFTSLYFSICIVSNVRKSSYRYVGTEVIVYI